jgi:hypothetical protein
MAYETLAADVGNANEKYKDQLLNKARNGQTLRPEELDFLSDYRNKKNVSIVANEQSYKDQLISKAKSGAELSNDELDFLQSYKEQKVPNQTKSDVGGLAESSKLQSALQASITNDSRALTSQDKIFSKQLSKIGPISNVDLTAPGDTPKLRLALKIYGQDNVMLNNKGELMVRPKGQSEYMELPVEAMGSSAIRFGKTVGASVLGEALGAPGGILGVAAGGATGSALAERNNIGEAIKKAQEFGIVHADEKRAFNDALNTATVTGGVLGGIFGGGVPVLKGALKAGSLKKLPSAIRSENNTVAQEATNFLRRFGVGSGDIQKTKAALRAEQMSDALGEEFAGVAPGSGGKVARDTITNFVNGVNDRSNKLFEDAVYSTEKKIQEGQAVPIIDLTDAFGAFKKKVLKEASKNDKPQVMSFLSDLKNEINYTKQQIASGQIPAHPNTVKQFADTVVDAQPKDVSIFGPGVIDSVSSQQLTPRFNPQKFTARDFNKTKNFLKDTLTSLDNPKYILDKNTKKNVTQFLKTIEQPFSQGADEASEIAMELGDDTIDLLKGNDSLGKVKFSDGVDDFQRIKDGYSVRAEGFKKVPLKVGDSVRKATTDTELETNLFKTDYTLAKQVRNLIDETASPDDKQLFTTSIKARLLNPSSSAGKKQIQRRTQEYVKPSVMDNAVLTDEELKAFQKQGGKPKAGPFGGIGGGSIKLSTEETIGAPTITEFQGNRAANVLAGTDSTPSALLGSDAPQVLQQSQELSGLQSSSGVAQSAADFPKTPNLSGLASNQAILPAVMNLIGSGVRPAARVGADVIEAASYFTPAATVPNVGGYLERNDFVEGLLGTKRRR